MNKILDEGSLRFDFSSFLHAERFDDRRKNPSGMKSVDFFAEDEDYVYFIEVKDYQNPNATQERRVSDWKMLSSAVNEKKSIFCIEMGAKIKDSLLRKYALGEVFNKKVYYFLLINLDNFGERERGMLKAKISGYVPTGLNADTYSSFAEITFDVVDIEQLKQHGIQAKEL